MTAAPKALVNALIAINLERKMSKTTRHNIKLFSLVSRVD